MRGDRNENIQLGLPTDGGCILLSSSSLLQNLDQSVFCGESETQNRASVMWLFITLIHVLTPSRARSMR